MKGHAWGRIPRVYVFRIFNFLVDLTLVKVYITTMRKYSDATIETETLITLNEADMKDGFFRIYTTRPNHLSKLIKRLGKKNIVFSNISLRDSREIGWDMKIPVRYLAKGSFCISSAKVSREKKQEIDPTWKPRPGNAEALKKARLHKGSPSATPSSKEK